MATDITYKPDKTVAEFIADYIPNELFYSFIVGAVGSGKTTGALMKIPYKSRTSH